MRLKNQGFTLIELLLAAALMGCVLVGVLSISAKLIGGWKSISKSVTYEREAYKILDRLEEELEGDCESVELCSQFIKKREEQEHVSLHVNAYDESTIDVRFGFREYPDKYYYRRIFLATQPLR